MLGDGDGGEAALTRVVQLVLLEEIGRICTREGAPEMVQPTPLRSGSAPPRPECRFWPAWRVALESRTRYWRMIPVEDALSRHEISPKGRAATSITVSLTSSCECSSAWLDRQLILLQRGRRPSVCRSIDQPRLDAI